MLVVAADFVSNSSVDSSLGLVELRRVAGQVEDFEYMLPPA